jgi:hypothetical protein
MIVDRTTWITNARSKTPMIYRLDTQLSIPLYVDRNSHGRCVHVKSIHRNPMGRTGVRGRGALIRWGPNKSIMAIITRWKKHRGQFAIVDGQRLLEALVFKDKLTNDWKLPGVGILLSNLFHVNIDMF